MTGLGPRKAGSGYSWHPSVVQNNKVQQGSWESPNYVSRNSTPPNQKKGVELIFHSFPNPPLHPSLIRLPDSPHPAPARRQPVLCHTSPSLSATSGRKLTNENKPRQPPPHACIRLSNCIESPRFIIFLFSQISSPVQRPRVSPEG